MDVQRFMDALSATNRDERSKYHVTLGGLISALERVHPEARVLIDKGFSPGTPDSYRGYYHDLAFAVTPERVTAGEFLKKLKDEVLGKSFEGYKGGDFVMGSGTPLWISEYGQCSDIAIVGIQMLDCNVVLVTKVVK